MINTTITLGLMNFETATMIGAPTETSLQLLIGSYTKISLSSSLPNCHRPDFAKRTQSLQGIELQ